MKMTCVKRFLGDFGVRTRFFATAAALSILLAGPPAGCSAARPAASSGVDSLVILHTNDVHSHLDPFEIRSGERVGGAAARAALIQRQRALGGRVLLLDAGDLVQGTPYYNRFRGEPDHRLLDLLGYDAIALGNHDLDDGAAAWRARANATRTPILSANVFAVAESSWAGGSDPAITVAARRSAKWVGGGKVPPGVTLRYLALPYTIVERGGLRIALFGLTTSSIDRIVAARPNRGVAVGSAVEAARELVPRLRRQADLVIAITHLGVDEDRRLVDHVPGIDLVIGGHSHTALLRPTLEKAEGGRGTPIAQAGSYGRYLGRTTLRWSGDLAAAAVGKLITVRPEEGEDPAVEAMLASYRSRLGADLALVVFRSPRRVESSSLREGDAPLGNFVADVMRERLNADIAVMNAGGIRAPLPAGDVRKRDMLTMLPFDNRLVVVSMTGLQVQRLLDRIARRLGKGGFGHLSGVSYVIRRDRAVEVRIWKRNGEASRNSERGGGGSRAREGDPIDMNRLYRVATVDFLADGGDFFDEVRDAASQERTDIVLSDAAIEYLLAHPEYSFRKDGRAQWRGSGEALRDMMGR